MERLREICKCLKTLVDFLLYHCDSLLKHNPKPWDLPFNLSQPKLDPPLAIAVAIFLFVVTALSSHYHHGELFVSLLIPEDWGEPEEFYPIRPDCRDEVVLLSIQPGKMLTGRRWRSPFSEEGHLDIARVLRRIQRGGVHPTIKGEAWEFLLGCYDPKSTFDERTQLRESRSYVLSDATTISPNNFSLVQGLGLDFTYGIAICSCALQLWVGRFLISNRKANGGEIITTLFAVILSSLISFVLIKSVIFKGLNQAVINFYSFEQGRIAGYKLFEMISYSNSSLNQDGSTLATMQGNIEFRNIYFSYLSRPKILILSGFYQNVPARKIVALVGRNDSRKSSIIPLMERFYDLTLDIKHLKLEWLRSQIGLVTQQPTLLSLSIKDNITYGRSATSDQIEEAAKTIHAHDFITSLEMGYETQVGRTGLTLTEEQKIKISIARVVLSNPSILLLDEVTSGLDFEAEKYQMDCKKFLQFIKEKKKRILDHKEASLKWKQKLKAWLFVNFLV
ncbi:hypothetical protein ZIOFF_011643 [Zingiber officinale]|uniref:ABC transporter domain-containing protein n=1 Tax=Zingiber officinale TaxID=94328 RepID=A0A8J5LQ78_ZINOF|nr:hypothetical protein ZIOFF_011643 [Zingiber officinale]